MKRGDKILFNTVHGLKSGEIINKLNGKYVIRCKGKIYRKFLKDLKGVRMKMYDEMVALAKAHNVEITENAVKIANFRERTGTPITVCPCAKGDAARGCISEKCLHEIETLGQCCCRAFKKKLTSEK